MDIINEFIKNGQVATTEFVTIKSMFGSSLEIARGMLVLFSTSCMFTLIFGVRRLVKKVPLVIGVYILILVVKEWAGLT